MIKLSFLISLSLFLIGSDLIAQCPSAAFTTDPEYCTDESIILTNETTGGATQHFWDFCVGDFEDNPTSATGAVIGSSNIPVGISVVNDSGLWYGFVVSRDNNRLFRIDFGVDLENETPDIIDLGTNAFYAGPEWIKLIKNGTDWVGFILNEDNSVLLRLHFDQGISEVPQVESLGDLGHLNRPKGIDLVDTGTEKIALVPNNGGGNLTIISFGNDWLNTLNTSSDVKSVIEMTNSIFGISLIKECDTWYGLTISRVAGDVFIIDFGNDIFNGTPTRSSSLGQIPASADLRLVRDGSEFYGFAIATNSNLYKVSFGGNIQNGTPAIVDLGNLGVASNSNGFDMVKDGSSWYGFRVDFFDERVLRIDFSENCASAIETSQEEFPSTAYSSPDLYEIELIAIDDDGDVNSQTQSVNIIPSVAPDINIDVNSNQCTSTSNQFTSTNVSGSITNYQWDLGDGTIMSGSTLTDVTHQYMMAGSYDVTLTVTSTDCSNRDNLTIEVFDEPIPDFSTPTGVLCAGSMIDFTNTSMNIPGSPGVITYHWDFNGEGTSTEENPTFTFPSGGMKDVTLTTSIPGCSDQITKQVDVLFGAVPDFTFNDICLGEIASFTNLSTGAGTTITEYAWTFGDGGNSTNESPTHLYTSIGDYQVSLDVTNDLGCTVNKTETISVHAIPNATFINDPACQGPVQFTDQSTVESANITEWLWDFDNGETSTERNPIPTFTQSMEFDVSLMVTSNFGCTDDVNETISVLSAPSPEFSFVQGCLGEQTQFNDQTVIESINPATGYFWQIEDEVYTDLNPQHRFEEPGTFTAFMTVSVANGCSVVASQEIVVPELPVPDFTFSNPCQNSITTFEDQTSDEGDPIISRTWDFDGLATANGPIAQFVFPEPGNYNIGLTTTSTLGCTAFIGKTITVAEQPVSSFTSSATLGPPPLSVNFTNQSTGGSTYSWFRNDEETAFSNDEHSALIFEEEGDYEIALVAFNESGCTDTLTQKIEVVFPAIDLTLSEILAVPNNGRTNIVLRGANNGTLAIEGFDIFVDLDGRTWVDSFDQTLLRGQPFAHTLSVALLDPVDAELLCIDLVIPDVDELDQDDNQDCLNFEPQIVVQDPFPNPAVGSLRINVIIPDVSDGVRISLMNIYGEIFIDQTFSQLREGLNQLDFNVAQLTSGLYIIRIQYGGKEEVRRVRVE